jgi:hypothetical protein
MSNAAEILQLMEADWGKAKVLTDGDRFILDRELDQLLKSIRECDTAGLADGLLQELGDLQEVMAIFAFKHDIELSERQRGIVRDYDRFDDLGVRHDAYQKTKNGEFPWVLSGLHGNET